VTHHADTESTENKGGALRAHTLLRVLRASVVNLRSLASRRASPAQAGFTLIEVLVALTILSISLAVLLAIFTQGLDRARESADEASARVLAQSLLAQAKAAASPSVGDSAGKANDLFWHLRIAPYGAPADRAAWQENAAEISATVSWRGDGGLRSITLSTLRLLPVAQKDNSD
jgi:general secretion pathway protein I